MINFGAIPYQNFGMATNLSSASGNYWAVFGTQATTNTLFAQVNVSGTTQAVSLGALPSGFHDYIGSSRFPAASSSRSMAWC